MYARTHARTHAKTHIHTHYPQAGEDPLCPGKRDQPMAWFKKMYCESNKVDMSRVHLTLGDEDGLSDEDVPDEETPHSLGLFDDQEIKVVLDRDIITLTVLDQVST